MAYRVRSCRTLEEWGQAVAAIGHYAGWVPTEEQVEQFAELLPPERLHAVFDGQSIVGGAGAFDFRMSVPGAVVPCSGVTVVGVLPTHRRRGLLSRMMRAQTFGTEYGTVPDGPGRDRTCDLGIKVLRRRLQVIARS